MGEETELRLSIEMRPTRGKQQPSGVFGLVIRNQLSKRLTGFAFAHREKSENPDTDSQLQDTRLFSPPLVKPSARSHVEQNRECLAESADELLKIVRRTPDPPVHPGDG